MAQTFDLSKLRTSWTKYDIVRVMDVISSEERISSYKEKEIVIDEPILKSFLGIRSLKDTTPQYWISIQNYPAEKKLFALLAVLFTHEEVIKLFATRYSNKNMGGLFVAEDSKMHTNIRSALVEAGAALANYRRQEEVPYDFSLIYKNGEVGRLFKEVLKERIGRVAPSILNDEEFYSACYSNNFDIAIGLTKEQFKAWLEGEPAIQLETSSYIKKVYVREFYSIREIDLNFENSKEIYFLGENGDGKSLVLMAIYLAFKGNFIRGISEVDNIAKAIRALNENPNFLPLGLDNANKEYGIGKDLALENIFAYGTHRGRYSTDEAEEYGFMSLFDADRTLINPETWLSRQKALELESLNKSSGESSAIQPTLSFSVTFLEEMFNDLLEKNVDVKVDVNKVEFIEKGSTVVSFHQLSEGYKSVMIFVCDLIFRLSQTTKDGQKINDVKGVVLVDEIDLHLHPKWQRVLVGKLRKIFPGIQFIFTTHSPTIIQGASDDAMIFKVYRTPENGTTTISDPYYRKELNHLMINSLVTSPLFGLEDSRLDSEDNNSDTSETYLIYRINKKLKSDLEVQKAAGKVFITDEEIDSMIQKILDEELNKND